MKVQVVATSEGLPVAFYIHAGAESAQTGRRGLALDLPAGSILYTDAGYPDYVAEDLFNEASGSQQQTARRQNSKRPH
ncbi:MAG: IS982 family transposase, partial [Hymenobacter sp.]